MVPKCQFVLLQVTALACQIVCKSGLLIPAYYPAYYQKVCRRLSAPD
jgi:hypothetical protein